MTLSIAVSAEIERRLRERAAATGTDPETYAAALIARDVSRPRLEELLAPIQADFAASGLSEAQLLELAQRAVDATRGRHQA